MYYTLSQLLLMFYIYCFLGWIWECCYVSVPAREWVNRGFLRGPVIPIYGFGAIITLWFTLPVKDSIPLIYIIGLVGASILEYVTGALMEKTFHMRYWDYSHHKYNLNGHISLFVSLGWGVFSVVLVKLLHPPIEYLVFKMPGFLTEIASYIFTIIFVVDTTTSIQSALDMKKLLKQLTENNRLFSTLELRLDSVASIINSRANQFQGQIQKIKTGMQEIINLESGKNSLVEKLQKVRSSKLKLVELLSEMNDTIIKEVKLKINSDFQRPDKTQLSKLLKDLNQHKIDLKKLELNIFSRKDKVYKEAAKLIRRNPTAVSKHFKEAFEEIKQLVKSKKFNKK